MSVLRKFGAAFAGALLALLAAGAATPASADTSWGYMVLPQSEKSEKKSP